MLKREIKYEDFNGDETSDVFYFNISKPELLELEVEYEGGFAAMMQKIIKEGDQKKLVQHFKDIILLAYGEKSPDGKHFIKTPDVRERFSYTAAFQSLFVELATNDGAAVTFLKGVLPRDMVGEIDKALPQDKPTGPPTPPTTTA